MTFTVIGRCNRTGKLGFAQATGTPAIGRRAVRVIPGMAVVVVQAGHNHFLMEIAVELAKAGFGAKRVFDAVTHSDPYSAQRQLMYIGTSGPGIALTGSESRPWCGHIEGEDFAVAGNVLAGEKVVANMAAAFSNNSPLELDERLMLALEAGRDAGGQADGERSATLFVCGDGPYPLFDLRVDVALEPTGELRKAYEWYKPLSPFYADCYDKGIPAKYKDYLRSINWPLVPFQDEPK
ncbi:MAG: DUF1028 domain-containing protein [Proteobacteria bacterium]|nr:DUF1028 domain-containing protein [Pseudomonadota bacterium]